MNRQSIPRPFRPGARHRRTARRGASIVVVLGLLSISLALSYAILRTQGTALQIQKNSSRRGSARQAALAGMSIALAKMHGPDWAGVDAALTGSLSDTETYSVSFVTGDASLNAGSPENADWPYRVTVTATGYAESADQVGTPSTHVIEAVVRLAPRQLGDAPADWLESQAFTVNQTGDSFTVELPCRIEGAVRMQGRLNLAEAYPTGSSAHSRYLTDLELARREGEADYRPFTGPVSLPTALQSGGTLHDLGTKLGVPIAAIAERSPVAWGQPSDLVTYRLYEGGASYTATTVGAVLQNVALGADPRTNPLGFYYCSGTVTLRNNVQIDGTLLVKNRIVVDGANVALRAVEQPLLDGTSVPFRLPAAVCDDFRVTRNGRGGVVGVVSAWDDFEIEVGSENAAYSVVGRIVCGQFLIDEREAWQSTPWGLYHLLFAAVISPVGLQKYFPHFVGTFGRPPTPVLTIKPPSASVTDHWLTPDEPLYSPHPADPGLRWNVVRWTDNP